MPIATTMTMVYRGSKLYKRDNKPYTPEAQYAIHCAIHPAGLQSLSSPPPRHVTTCFPKLRPLFGITAVMHSAMSPRVGARMFSRVWSGNCASTSTNFPVTVSFDTLHAGFSLLSSGAGVKGTRCLSTLIGVCTSKGSVASLGAMGYCDRIFRHISTYPVTSTARHLPKRSKHANKAKENLVRAEPGYGHLSDRSL